MNDEIEEPINCPQCRDIEIDEIAEGEWECQQCYCVFNNSGHILQDGKELKNSKDQEEIIRIAEQIARTTHKHQKRWNGKDYITHPKAVADNFEKAEYKIVAWLHDVLEDSKLTFKDLIKKGIPHHLAESVNYLTKKKNQNYKDYILQVCNNEIAIKVKLADLKHNLSDLKKGSMKDKYILATHILKEKEKQK